MNQGMTRRGLLAAALALTMTSCSQKKGEQPVKQGDNVLRHDLEPLIKRLPVLADAPSASWASGTLGESRAPGPSLYWIDAVVELDDATYSQAEAIGGAVTPLPDSLHELVRPEASDGAYASHSGLDEFFSDGGWQATAYLHTMKPVVVLEIVGEKPLGRVRRIGGWRSRHSAHGRGQVGRGGICG